MNTTADPNPATLTANACATSVADQCSLREAILEANAAGGATTITLPAGTYLLTYASAGDLDITSNITIIGAGSATTIIKSNGLNDRIFDVANNASVSLTGITITGGVTTSDGAGIRFAGTGALSMTDVVVDGNSAGGDGGGIYFSGSGTVTLANSRVSNNISSNDGGGIRTTSTSSTLNVTNSTVSNNSAASSGGGLRTMGTTTITSSTINGNRADAETILVGGGGIYHGTVFVTARPLTITNSTISGNVIPGGRPGAGVRLENGSLTLTNSTIALNSSGVYRVGAIGSIGAATIKNSILAGSTSGDNCSGTITNGGGNIDSGASCGFAPGDSNNDPLLAPLAVNLPGTTATHALQPLSPAIGHADCSITVDQRGVARPQGATCDSGAYELLPAPTISGNPVPNSGTTSGGTPITITGTGFQSGVVVTIAGNPCTGVVVGGGTVVNGTTLDGTTIACTTPAGATGAAPLLVKNTDTQSAASSTFTYVAPTIASITPAEGSSGGGTAVTIVGTGFDANATVTIGIAPCLAVSVNGTGTQITCTTPPGTAGTADVVVTNPNAPSPSGTATLPAGYRYLSPAQVAFSPSGLAFGDQQINTASAAQVVTLKNTGTATLNVGAVALTGANAADFVIVGGSDSCTGAALLLNQTCTVSVTFTPTAVAARGAALTFTDNDGGNAGSQQNILLSGTGTPTPPPNHTITVSTSGPGTVSPGTGVHPEGAVVAYTATPNTGAVLLGWTVDGTFVGFGNPLTFTVTKDRTIVATFAARVTFSDIPSTDGNYEAITQLATRGIVNPAGVNGSGRFEPNRAIVRAESAGLIARAFGWSTEQRTNPFPDRCDPQGENCIDDELWNNVAVLSFHNVVFGYPGAPTCQGAGTTPPCYLPRNPVLNVQVISFITRAFNEKNYWQKSNADTPGLYSNVPVESGHRLDLATYVQNAGAVPGQATTGPFNGYDQAASRRFYAQALWQAFSAYFSTNRLP